MALILPRRMRIAVLQPRPCRPRSFFGWFRKDASASSKNTPPEAPTTPTAEDAERKLRHDRMYFLPTLNPNMSFMTFYFGVPQQ